MAIFLGTDEVQVFCGQPVGGANLQTVSKSYTPTESTQTDTITPSTGYDGIEEVEITVSPISSNYIGSGVPRMSSANLSASGATVTAPSGYYASNATKTISSGSATPASSITGTTATVSSPSSNKIQLTQTISNTPTVSAGYISSGTAGNTSVTLTGACITKGATSYYASTSDQTIGSGTYITGTQTFKAVSQTNLSAGNIKNGTTISISNGNGNIWSVTGTYGGGGGDSKNVQLVQNNSTRITSTSYTKACGTITVSKSGTYDIYWCAYRTSSSGTWGTQWYKNGTAQGSVQSFSSYYQAIHLTNISLAEDDKIDVYGRSRGTNYYLYVGQLTIIEV